MAVKLAILAGAASSCSAWALSAEVSSMVDCGLLARHRHLGELLVSSLGVRLQLAGSSLRVLLRVFGKSTCIKDSRAPTIALAMSHGALCGSLVSSWSGSLCFRGSSSAFRARLYANFLLFSEVAGVSPV